MAIQRFHRGRLRHGLLQQGQRLGQTPSQGIGVPQEGKVHGEPVTDVPLLAECQALFEPGDSHGYVTFVEVETADTALRKDQAEGVLRRFSQLDAGFAVGQAGGKFT
jgi:hypothetical protein